MAQTISQIKKEMTDSFVGNSSIASLYGLTTGQTFDQQFSSVSIESILFDIVSFCVWGLQKLFDAHREEVKTIIYNENPHRPPWYVTMALAFQFGRSLVTDEDYYDNTGLTEAQIETEKIVKYAAAVEVTKGMRIKANRIVSGDLAPLTGPQLTSFTAYMNRIKDAGVRLYVSSSAPDSLKLNLDIYYNALVLDSAGARLDGTSTTPIPDAIDAFLKNQPFNGLFILDLLISELKKVDGVIIPNVVLAQARYGALPYQTFDVEYLPDGGYLRIVVPADLVVNYYPHEPI